jgi:hypothetical protein
MMVRGQVFPVVSFQPGVETGGLCAYIPSRTIDGYIHQERLTTWIETAGVEQVSK